jgi:uncharacterized repeat protein (TIGR01451 family)
MLARKLAQLKVGVITTVKQNANLIFGMFILLPVTAFAGLGASVTLGSGQPGLIYPGEVTELQITLSNSNTTASITGAAFSNLLPGALPNGLKISGVPTYTCANNAGPVAVVGTLTATNGTQTISLSGGSIPARAGSTDGTCTITVPVTAGTTTGNAATYTYTIADGAVTGNDGAPVANVGNVNQSINVRALAKPTITKSFGTPTLTLGGASTPLQVTVSNSNSIAIPNFTITDLFPALGAGGGIIKVSAATVNTATCTSGPQPTFSPTPAAGVTSISGTGTIPANGSCTFKVDVEAAHTNGAFTTGVQQNTINATTQFSNDLGLSAANNATANITVNSPLQVNKQVSAGALAAGQAGFFTITLTNAGPSPLAVTSFTDSPIDGSTVGAGLTVTGESTTCAGGVVTRTASDEGVTLTGGTIPANGSCIVTINFTGATQSANTPITYTNNIPQGAVDVGNPAIVSQQRSASITILDTLNVSKSVTPANAAPGSPVRYTVTVQNWTNAPISNATITDSLTNGQTFLNGNINGIDYTPTTTCNSVTTSNVTGNTSAVLTIGTVPARTGASTPGSCNVTFWAMTSTAGGAYNNILLSGDVCYGSGPAICNGSATANANGTTASTLSVNKTFSQGGTVNPPSVLTRSEGTIVRMTVTLNNLSVNPLTAVNMSDTLPVSGGQQMLIATPSNASTTCGGTITAVAGSSSVALNGATVPARSGGGLGAAGTCTVQVDVVGAAGIYNNTATVTATETFANNVVNSTNLVVNSNVATITYSSALGATKSFVPASISSGGKSTLTIRLSNAGALALANVAVTDPLPSGMSVANPVNAHTSCAGATAITATPGATSASMTGAAIAGGGSCDLVFDVVATGGANWVNTIPVGNITADDGVKNQAAVVGTLNNVAPTALSVSKATNPSSLTFPGQVSQMTITINNGSQAVNGLNLTDYFTADGTSGALANGMIISSTPAASTTCTSGTVVAAAGGSSVALTGASMAANASCTMTVNVTSNKIGGITNFIPSGSIVTSQGLTNAGQATTSLTTQSNIGLTKQFTPNVVKPGERSRLRITFYNPAAQPAANVNVTDTLPAGVTVAAVPNPFNNCGATVASPASNQVQVSGGNIAGTSGATVASCYAEIDVVAATQGDFVNTIPAGALTAVIGGINVANSQPTSDTLHAKSPLLVHKAFSNLTLDVGNPVGFTTGSDSKSPGAPSTMTIRLDNPNNVALTGAALTDNLPTGLVVAITPSASTTCVGGTVSAAASATNVKLTGATIPANGFCTVTVNVLSNISGSYDNTIAAGAVTTIEGASNEEPTSARLVVSTPPTVAKQFSPAVIPPNGVSTLTIVLGNPNASAVTLTSVFTDTLPTAPGPVTVAATPNIGGTCTTASVTAAAGSGTVSYANGATVPAGGCTITVDVTGVAAGDHTNNIPAGTLQTNFGNNQQPANAVLKISTLGFISGRVFQDNNTVPNGTYQSGTDTPIQGNSIELHNGNSCAGALAATINTDALGNYLFSGLPAGTYSVCQPIQPATTTNGITTAGTINTVNGSTGTVGTATIQTVVPSAITNIILGGGGAGGEISGSPNNNFAEVVLSSISGKVFLDQNNNGTQQGADAGINGVTIELLNNVGTVVATTTTDALGNYTFANLVPGTYSVREPVQPTATTNGITTAGLVPNGGTVGTATGVGVLPSQISNIVLPPNTASTANNFAEIANGRSISGLVFLDYNNNALVNGSDHGIGGQTVELTGVDINGVAITPRTTTTAADGTYSFTGLPEGTYQVRQPNQPAGTTNGTTVAGSTGGTATAVGVTPSVISAISLVGVNTVSGNNNFAEIPGAAPDLTITKTHAPVTFGSGSSTGYFTVTPSNIGAVATTGTVTVVDTMPAGITPTAATGTGWTCNIAGQVVTCTTNAVIAANGGLGNPITLNATVATGLDGQLRTNTAVVSGGGEPAGFDGNNTANDTVAIATVARLSGSVWVDANHDRVLDGSETKLKDWKVELLLNGVVVANTVTNTAGFYQFVDLAPSTGYQVRFRDPDTNAIYGRAVTNERGATITNGVRDTGATTNNGTNVTTNVNPAGATLTGDGTLPSLTLLSGDNIIQQSLPIDPSGVVYNSITRQPVQNATVTILGPGGTAVPTSCLISGQNPQQTNALGWYTFQLNGAGGCPGNGVYTLQVVQPSGYLPPVATLGGVNPPAGTLPVTGPFGGANPIQAQVGPPPVGTNGAGTIYYFSLTIDLLASANIVNNHIPLDPVLNNSFIVTKTGNKSIAEIGDTITYTVKARLTNGLALSTFDLVDNLPAGFRYIPGTATQAIDGNAATPLANPLPAGNLGPQLTFKPSFATPITNATITYKVRVGVGAMQGDGINRVQGRAIGGITSNTAQFKVKVTGGVFTNDACVAGKVFVDCNNNHIQDAEELGIPGVRMYMEDGTYFISDVEGKYSYCGISPKTHVLKVDSLTMPRGSRMTITSNRNAGDANSLFLDTKNGELIRADFAEGSCSNTVLEQVKARRTGGEVRAPETEKKGGPAIKFEGKSPAYPQQGTDSANQRLVKPRGGAGDAPVSNTVNDNPVQPLTESSGNTRGDNLRDQKGEAK